MTILYRCTEDCGSNFALADEDPDLRLLSPIMGCVNAPICTGKLRIIDNPPCLMKFEATTAKQLFVSIEGGGIPSERRCGVDSLSKAVLNKRIVKLKATPAGSDANRSIISSIEMDDGTVVIFAASTLGATVSKIVRNDAS